MSGDEVVWFPTDEAYDAMDMEGVRHGVVQSVEGTQAKVFFEDSGTVETVDDNLLALAEEIEHLLQEKLEQAEN